LRVGVPRSKTLQHHQATALDARVGGLDRGGHEVREGHVGDEPTALLHLEQRLLVLSPLHDPHLAAQQPRLDADVRNRLGQRECAAQDRLSVGAGSRGHVTPDLRGGAALANRREGEVLRKVADRGACIDPRQFERDER
jgi:hypothetical protein